MKKQLLFVAVATFLSVGNVSFAQTKIKYSKEQLRIMDNDLFDEMFVGVSSKKDSRILLKNGQQLAGKVSGLDRKKGQIYSVTMKDESGKKTSYSSEEISEMYLPISNYSKAAKMNSYFGNSKNWGRKSLNKSTNPDEIYVRNVKANLKNKGDEKEFLMQLLNPTFDHVIEVYADPNASQTTSVGFGGGPAISGGVIKSYYVMKNNQTIWLKKNEFEDHYQFLFGDNPNFIKEYPFQSIKWEHLSFLIAKYTEMSAS